MLRTLTTIGILIAIALPLIDMALFRPARRGLGSARMLRIERLIYLLFLLAVLLQAVSSFGMIIAGERMHGWMLVMHMSMAGLFAVTLTALAVLWAEQASFERGAALPAIARFYSGEKVAFWLTLIAGLATIVSAMLGMMTWFGSDGQVTLLRVHRYSALLLLICTVFHGYRLLAGRPRERVPASGSAASVGATR
jgi:hypothetical protein